MSKIVEDSLGFIRALGSVKMLNRVVVILGIKYLEEYEKSWHKNDRRLPE